MTPITSALPASVPSQQAWKWGHLIIPILGGEGRGCRGQVCCPRSQRSDGTVTAPQADRPTPGARAYHPLTFGCGVIIRNEHLPDVVGASEVLEGHGAGGGLVGEVEARAGPPQGRGRGRGAVQDVKVFVGAVQAARKRMAPQGPGGSPVGVLGGRPLCYDSKEAADRGNTGLQTKDAFLFPHFSLKEEWGFNWGRREAAAALGVP